MKNGFTLVEIISVIVILSLVVIISVPAYSEMSSAIKTTTYNNKISAINSSTLKYASAYLLDDIKPESCKSNCHKCYDLYDFIIKNGIYVTEKTLEDGTDVIINPLTNEKLEGCVDITFNISDASLEVNFITE